VGLGACGDPLVSANLANTPRETIDGMVFSLSQADVTSPLVDVLWVDPLSERPDVPAPPVTLSSTLAPSGVFTLSLYAPPPRAATRTLPLPMDASASVTFAFGELVLVDDVNHDGTFAVGPGNEIVAPDKYASAVGSFVVLYVESPAPPAEGIPELGDTLSGPVGYQVIAIDCTEPATPHSIEVPLMTFPVTLYVDPESATLTYGRQCLRSHVVAASAPTGP
jgi:hypothetical protein